MMWRQACKRLWISAVFVFVSAAHADEIDPIRSTPAPARLDVIILRNDVDVQNLDSAKFSLKKFQDLSPTIEELLPIEERNRILFNIGLSSYVQEMDDLDRDLLLWRLTYKGAQSAFERYPKIPLKVLKEARSKFDRLKKKN